MTMTLQRYPTYDASFAAIPGVAAANNYVSLFNPVGSGKIMLPTGFFISSTCVTPLDLTDPMRVLRITASSGGNLVATADVAKFSTAHPNHTAELRTGNPTVTLGAAIINSPQPIDKRSSNVHQIDLPPGASFVCRPGEGLVLRTEAGNTGVFWNVSLVWVER